MITAKLQALIRRSKGIYQQEGFISFLGHVYDYIATRSLKYEKYYLYEHTLKERNEVDFIPRIQNCKLIIIHNQNMADELVTDTGFNLRNQTFNATKLLDKGAIAFCVFVDGEFAHIGWVTTDNEAKKALDPLPYKVDFSNHQACTGGTFTIPKYRGKGLMAYGYFERLRFLWYNGYTTCRCAVNFNNIASQRMHNKLNPIVYARAFSFIILRWRLWREEPFVGHDLIKQFPQPKS